MVWAVRASDPMQFVHVGLLKKSEKGALCDCQCRGCGQALLAINVDKPPEHFMREGAQRKHFRHRSVSAADALCQRQVAQLLALQLFVEQDSVYLPERERRVQRRLPNGAIATADLGSAAVEAAVLRRTWVDDWSAVLLLDDGRELTVTVRTRQTFDTQDGARCVLSLAGACPPAIAGWGEDEILAHLRAPRNGMEWARHWDDVERGAQVDDELARQQAELLGEIPPEWLAGLTGKQFSETILHFLIKKAVAERGFIEVPAYREAERRTMPDGKPVQISATWPACRLVLEEVRLEKRLGNMVPDVMCRAHPSNARNLSFDLMIEGAVTHLVDAEKTGKIKAADVACLEVVARNFERVGHIPAREIEELVCSSMSAKQWIHLPIAHAAARRLLEDQAAATKKRLLAEQRARAAEERAAKRQAEDEKRATARVDRWIIDSSDATLVKGYLKILTQLWSGDTSFSQGIKAEHHQSVLVALRERQILVESTFSVESSYGILRKLMVAHRGDWQSTGAMSLDRLAAAARGGEDSSHAVDLMAALAGRRAEMDTQQQEAYDRSCVAVRREVELENPRFQRDAKNQKLHALAVPALAEPANRDLATPAHFARLKHARQEKERRATVRHQRIERVKAGRLAQKKMAESQAIDAAIEAVSGRIQWRSFVFENPSTVSLLARYSQNRPADLRFAHLSAQDLLSTAERLRRSSASVSVALRAIDFTVAGDVVMAGRALVHAGLCFARDT